MSASIAWACWFTAVVLALFGAALYSIPAIGGALALLVLAWLFGRRAYYAH